MRPPSLSTALPGGSASVRQHVFSPLKSPRKPQLQLVLSIGRWWEPLRAIHAAHHQAIRERNHLEFHTYLQGIRLAAMVNRLRKGSLDMAAPKRISLFPLGDLQTFQDAFD